jgi:chemotaxis protein MotB
VQKPHDKQHDQAVIKRAGRKHAHDEHGGAWKVAFADFCLALLSLFLVLWLMAARKQEATEAILRDGMKGSKFDEGKGVMPETIGGGPSGSLIERFPTPRDGGEVRDGEKPKQASTQASAATEQKKVSYETQEDLQSLSRALTKMSAEFGLSSNLESVVTPYGLRVMLHDTDKQGMFVRGSAIPTDRFKHLLRKMGPLFAQMTNQMLIVGHTDSAQYTNTDYNAFSNWTLSSLRAMAARAQLLIGTMNPESVLQVVGMADRAPLDPKDSTAAVNRRIEMLVLTRGQAQSISAMFGRSGNAQPLTDDVETELPDATELKRLRQKLVSPARNGASHAQE